MSRHDSPLSRVRLALFACLALTASALAARGEDPPFQLNEKALERVDFEGLTLPTSVEELKRQYPEAMLDADRFDKEIGLECYVVAGLKNADEARFYFCDGQFYQVELEYAQPRIETLGGTKAVMQRLIAKWGPADHVGESRWTWQRPMYTRRADFYVLRQGARLVITDTRLVPIVSSRLKRATPKQSASLGI